MDNHLVINMTFKQRIHLLYMLLRIENCDVIPIQRRYMEFGSIDELLSYLHRNKVREISLHKIDKINESSLWILYMRTPKSFLKLCQNDGVCGVCLGKIDKEGDVRQFNDKKCYDCGFVYCNGCGRKIGKMNSKSIRDIFYENSRHSSIEYDFIPIPIDCGACGGTGQQEIYNGNFPTGEYEPCNTCDGSKMRTVKKDITEV